MRAGGHHRGQCGALLIKRPCQCDAGLDPGVGMRMVLVGAGRGCHDYPVDATEVRSDGQTGRDEQGCVCVCVSFWQVWPRATQAQQWKAIISWPNALDSTCAKGDWQDRQASGGCSILAETLRVCALTQNVILKMQTQRESACEAMVSARGGLR